MRVERTCPVCSTLYETESSRLKYGRGTTCSPECSYILRGKNSNRSGPTQPCVVCGVPVPGKPPSKQARSKSGLPLCSCECQYKARSLGLAPRPVCGPYRTQAKPTPIINDAFGHWLAGLIAGEGCFRVHSSKKGAYLSCSFQLKLRDDDTPILQEIQKTLLLGRLNPESRSGNSNPCLRWTVDTKAECPALVELLERYPLRARKAQDFALWKQAVQVWTSMKPGNRWAGAPDWSTMKALKAQIEETREYKTPL